MDVLDYQAMAQRLYRVLLNMPCACSEKWDQGKRVLIRRCGRCTVVADYENMTATDAAPGPESSIVPPTR